MSSATRGDCGDRGRADHLAPGELLPAEGPVLADDEVDLERAPGVDDVELPAPKQGVPGPGGIHEVKIVVEGLKRHNISTTVSR
jgi:hypothetical protein